MNRERVLVGMSGGVDSTLAAKLLADKGYDCVGCTMLLSDGQDVETARAAADQLGIPFHVFDFRDTFRRQVIEPFIAAYEAGRTPNPCINCNRRLKFGVMFCRAEELDCRWVATGHYARVEERGGRYLLKRAADPSKDQTYFLACLTQARLAHIKFPLGRYTKAEVRELAREAGLVNAGKKDSQDICFVPGGDYAAVMEEYTGKVYPEGDYLDQSGQIVGRHRGAVRYTLGQRKGLNLAMGTPVYVCAKDMERNTVTVGPESALYSAALRAEGINWYPFDEPEGPVRCTVKTRHSQRESSATVRPLEGGKALVEFDTPQRAVTPGQAAVFYDGDIVLGGGTIAEALRQRGPTPAQEVRGTTQAP